MVLPKRLLLLNYNINAQLYILNQRNFAYCAVSSQLSYFTLNIIDFAGATFLINKRVWLKTCLLEFIIHLVTVLCMYSFTCLCTHLFVACMHVNSFLLQRHNWMKCCAACEVRWLKSGFKISIRSNITKSLRRRRKKRHSTQFYSLVVEWLVVFRATSVILHHFHKHYVSYPSLILAFISPMELTWNHHVYLFVIKYDIAAALSACYFFDCYAF